MCNAFTLIESSAATEGNSGQTAKVLQEKADTLPLEDENVAREDVVTTMDENANVTEEEECRRFHGGICCGSGAEG